MKNGVEKSGQYEPKNIYGILMSILEIDQTVNYDRKHLWVIGFSRKYNIQYIDLIDPKTEIKPSYNISSIYRLAMMKEISKLMIAEYRPSKTVVPSDKDITAVSRLKSGSNLLHIQFIDYLIISKESYYSFHESRELIPSGK